MLRFQQELCLHVSMWFNAYFDVQGICTSNFSFLPATGASLSNTFMTQKPPKISIYYIPVVFTHYLEWIWKNISNIQLIVYPINCSNGRHVIKTCHDHLDVPGWNVNIAPKTSPKRWYALRSLHKKMTLDPSSLHRNLSCITYFYQLLGVCGQ